MLYELTIALKSDLAAEKVKKVFEGVEEEVAKAGGRRPEALPGGKVEKIENLGVKNLSYPIKSLTQASFSRLQLEIDSDKVNALRRQLEKEEEFLRVFLVKVKGGETA
ncbi:MAG: 30S ribosomal protein S6 [candidate division WWE3 bacterium]|nr:30S ribosomal protein S6 [candidate division WWE3 bacterium]